MTVKSDRFDGWRIVIATGFTAGLAVAMAAAFLYHSSRTAHVGPTSAALSDAFSELAGMCLGLTLGSLATAAFVRDLALAPASSSESSPSSLAWCRTRG